MDGKRLSGKWNAFAHIDTHTHMDLIIFDTQHPTRDLIYYILLLTLIKGNDGYKIDGFHCSIPVLRPFSNYGEYMKFFYLFFFEILETLKHHNNIVKLKAK